jgi:phage I-like protein
LLKQTSTPNRYTALLEEEGEDQQHKAGPENTPKPPIYITDVKNISQLIQLLNQIAKHQYEIKALADNQVKVQLNTSESYRTIKKALAEKRTEFHTYKLKEERCDRVVKVKVTLRLTVSQSVCLGAEPKYGTFDQIFFF